MEEIQKTVATELYILFFWGTWTSSSLSFRAQYWDFSGFQLSTVACLFRELVDRFEMQRCILYSTLKCPEPRKI